MDWLEMRQEEAYRENERQARKEIDAWNKAHAIGSHIECQHFIDGKEKSVNGPTTSKAYYDFPIAVVDVKGCEKVPLYCLTRKNEIP